MNSQGRAGKNESDPQWNSRNENIRHALPQVGGSLIFVLGGFITLRAEEEEEEEEEEAVVDVS